VCEFFGQQFCQASVLAPAAGRLFLYFRCLSKKIDQQKWTHFFGHMCHGVFAWYFLSSFHSEGI